MARFRRGYGLSVSGYWASGDYDFGHPLLMGKNLPGRLGLLWNCYSLVCDHGSSKRQDRQNLPALLCLQDGKVMAGEKAMASNRQPVQRTVTDWEMMVFRNLMLT